MKQVWDPDTDVTQILELLYREYKITKINILRVLMEKNDNMQEQTGNIRKEVQL